MQGTSETEIKEEQKPSHNNMSSSLTQETKSKAVMENRLIPLHSTRVSAVGLLVLVRANKFMLITTPPDSVLGGVECC